jgi:hypothetical protein
VPNVLFGTRVAFAPLLIFGRGLPSRMWGLNVPISGVGVFSAMGRRRCKTGWLVGKGGGGGGHALPPAVFDGRGRLGRAGCMCSCLPSGWAPGNVEFDFVFLVCYRYPVALPLRKGCL